MSPETAILLALAIPLVGAPLIVVFRRVPNRREAVTLVTAALLFLAVARLIPVVMAGGRPAVTLFEILPGLPIAFEVEPLGMVFAAVASFLWIVTSVYSIGYMRGHHEKNQTRFYVCFAIALWAAIGAAFAGNMLTLFLFYEVLTICTYPLVTHSGTREAVAAGRTYLGILLSTSIGLQLLALIGTWTLTGTLDFAPGGILEGKVGPGLAAVLYALYLFGIGKAALMPLHRWLPAAMVAPAPVSALLHAVAVVKAGVFTVMKVTVYIFGIDFLAEAGASQIMMYVAGATILIASLVALRQDNLKRRLAYSTVSQLSYIVLGATLANGLGAIGGAMHIAMHAFGKITLFFCAGAIDVAAHKTQVSQLNGIGRRMPITMGAFAIGSLSMIGVPPTAGFLSKWYMLLGSFEAEQMFAVVVIVASTLLNAAYFLPIVYAAFCRPPDPAAEPAAAEGGEEHGEAPLPIVLAVSVTALGTVLLFFLPQLPLELARDMIGGAP
jgi:multicomponent Na+:H+ antiporter subunit D